MATESRLSWRSRMDAGMSFFYRGFLRFLGVINWDPHERALEKTFLSGCLNVWTGTDHYTANTVLTPFERYSKPCGFTPAEAEGGRKASGHSDRMDLARKRCGGYRLGGGEILSPAAVCASSPTPEWEAPRLAGRSVEPASPGLLLRMPSLRS